MNIDEKLVSQLIATQFPHWANLPLRPVDAGGWDNRVFHLGNQMLVRMPSAECYASQVEKEQFWLPKLAPLLPIPISTPLALGKPAENYPWKWSIYRWIEGETAASSPVANLGEFAGDLARFLLALQSIDSAGGPAAGKQNFHRGGSLSVYDAETRQAISDLAARINVSLLTEIWDAGCATIWTKAPVWVHGDISAGNLLVKNHRLSAVIDFGQLGVGDPACDVVIAWTYLDAYSRPAFREALSIDANTWARGRAWALWKALIVAVKPDNTNAVEARQAWRTIEQIIAEWKATREAGR
ncbi:aminoglycoside phosphotransferase family protein [Serratia entomophila]|uniref:Aminoglycoside phosphotransferase family protein n=1 Tax=Serratia entomophila TaxID=42906 RepID=A0ABY5CR85_9GAMM|nr:aminoglycoside phosphotransferase family protein [Serratia entomophila]USV00424.1 aminoglycoside phosphotransferase family protein [Serratia entomophila]CAI0697841.1 Aminoglycoside phosphotransferase [Serratia entomophila]CAI0760690.1 Aminoglycoside phosphotransferase [Serratia entomophila]CAI0992385.1 Aminoglycoside phosphotransferase [Serratia entomophila]CAI1002594.1 Aminoglycoside phosphotransferase [Serratia entomophila]